MWFTSLDRIYHTLFGDFSLSRLLGGAFALMLILTVGLTSYLIINNSQKTVDSIVIKFAQNVADDVNTDLLQFLEIPTIINTNTQHAIKAGRVDLENNDSISRFLWDAANRNTNNLVTSIYFADVNGKYIGIDVANSESQDAKNLITASAPFTNGLFTNIAPGPNGILGEPIDARDLDLYDPRERPWYQNAMANPDKAVWTNIYTDFDTGQAIITRAITVRGDDNVILGVAAVDLLLEHLQKFLNTLIISNNTEVFITDGEDLLVAAVAPGIITDRPSYNIPSNQTPFPYTKAATEYMETNVDQQSKADVTRSVSLTLEGEEGLLYVSPIAEQFGLSWKLGIFLPKSDFVSNIWDQLKLLLPLIFVVLLTAISTIMGLLLLVVKPLRQLSTNASLIAAGNFSVPIPAGGKNEVGVLARSFEHMQSQLNSTFENLLLRDRAIAELDVGVIICDAKKENFPILYVNNKLVSLTGYTAEECLGTGLLNLEGVEPNHPAINTLRAALEKNDSAQVTFKSNTKDGVEYIREVAISPVRDNHGQTNHYISLHKDITERVNTEAQLRRAQKNDAIGQLSGGIAHDFNNLLSIISGRLELISITAEDELAQQHIVEAEHAIDMGARLTHRLLASARQGALEPTLVNLNEQVENTLLILKPTIGKNIELISELDSAIWPICIDPSEIENTVVNLTINARDAMPDGGTIRIKTSNVTLDTQAAHNVSVNEGDYVQLTVNDSGTGMTDETKSRLFEPFYTTKALDKGTGMGLASIYGFAIQSGGNITVSSELTEGTSFQIYLPRYIESESKIEVLAANAEQYSSDSQPPLKNQYSVLVVEDNPSTREIVVNRFNSLGLSIIEAESAQAALRILESDRKVDLLFCDLVLGGEMSAQDLAHWTHTNCPSCKILLTSGFTDKHMVDFKADTPRWRVLQKPYKFDALKEAVENLIN